MSREQNSSAISMAQTGRTCALSRSLISPRESSLGRAMTIAAITGNTDVGRIYMPMAVMMPASTPSTTLFACRVSCAHSESMNRRSTMTGTAKDELYTQKPR